MKTLFISIILVLSLDKVSEAKPPKTVNGLLELYLPLPIHNDISQKYSFGAGGVLGLSFYLPKSNFYIIPRVGFDFMPRDVGVDDTYKENIFTTRFGLEGMIELVESSNYQLLPFIGIDMKYVKDFYKVFNGGIYTNGGLSYDNEPPLFKASSPALSLGIENRIGSVCIRLAYEYYRPKVTADLSNSFDDIDDEIFRNTNTKLNFSTIRIGIGAYFGKIK